MIGFVAALSSSLSIVILIMSVMLVNSLSTSKQRNEYGINTNINASDSKNKAVSSDTWNVSLSSGKDGGAINRNSININRILDCSFYS